MKCQILYSGKNTNIIINLSAKFVRRVVKVTIQTDMHEQTVQSQLKKQYDLGLHGLSFTLKKNGLALHGDNFLRRWTGDDFVF